MKESGIYNADNINIAGVNLQGVNLNLNGFNHNISNENIVNGTGYFAQQLNLNNNGKGGPQAAYINLIPPGYSITKIIATTNGLTTGISVAMGLATDDSALVTILSDSLNTGNLVWTGASKSATGNRSFYVQATGDFALINLNIYVEITYLNTVKNYVAYRR